MNSDAPDIQPDVLPFPGSPQQPVAPRKRNLVVWMFAAVVLLAWLSTGFFVVGADEVAVLRVFGKAQRDDAGNIELRPSRLYYHLPWPITQIDRIRINESRTLTVGTLELENLDSSEFLTTVDPARQSELLTGDRNILDLQIHLQYRVSRESVGEWLYQSSDAESRLRNLAGSVLADVVMRSGVDFVHTLGHAEIRRQMLSRLREASQLVRLGIEIDDVSIAGATPPVRVKAEFVDVMNARADRQTDIQTAQAIAEQKRSSAEASERRILDEANSYARRTTESARAQADSFHKIIDELERASSTGDYSYAQIRQLALQRRYLKTLSSVYEQVQGKVFLDSGQPVDITLHRNPDE